MYNKGLKIEKESFKIIDSLVDLSGFKQDESMIIKRGIHATGDIEIYKEFRFSKNWRSAAKRLFADTYTVVTDVNMVKIGISSRYSDAICLINDEENIAIASEKGFTRAESSIYLCYKRYDKIIFVIGNAPTALLKVIELYHNEPKDIFVIGIPVGFVSAAESKELLANSDIPHITMLGTKGGSPVAAAVFNALYDIVGGLA
jgi:precorrin-8X/cobalt-precorrin-8 methylmutase